MGTAVEYGYKNTSVGGGYSKAVKTSAGVNFSVGHDVIRDLEVEYDYYHYGLYCQMSGDATKWRYTNVRELRPYVFKGFNRSTTYSSYYTCPKAKWRGTLGHSLWVSRSATSELSMQSGFGLDTDGLGATVSVWGKQVNDSSHTKTYTPTSSGAKICGQDGNPTQTEKVLENEG